MFDSHVSAVAGGSITSSTVSSNHGTHVEPTQDGLQLGDLQVGDRIMAVNGRVSSGASDVIAAG